MKKAFTMVELLTLLKDIKKDFLKDGFVIDGFFGSYARNEATQKSDLDLLYHLDKRFYEKYQGFVGFKRLDEIKNTIAKRLELNVDLAPKNNLSKTAQKYILEEVIYV